MFMVHGTLVVGKIGLASSSSKIAAFDLDWTLIQTQSGYPYCRSYEDWKVWDERVVTKM